MCVEEYYSNSKATMAANSLGYIKKDSDVETLTVSSRPISLVLVGDSGSLVGAAVAAHTLKVLGTTVDLVIPAGYTVYRTDIRVVTAPDSANHTATLAVGTSAAAACFNTAEIVTAWPLGDSLITGNVATTHTAVAGETASVTVGGADGALTAGRVLVYLNLYASV